MTRGNTVAARLGTLREVESSAVTIFLGAVLLSALAGALVDHVRFRTVLSIGLVVGLVICARKVWGSVVVAGVPLLVPDMKTTLGIEGPLLLTLLTSIAALLYWDTLGRPKVPSTVLWAASIFAVSAFGLSWRHGGEDLQQAAWISIMPFTGLVFGACLASSPTARKAFGYGCVPLALLAYGEVAGFHNPWPHLVHSTNFLALSQRVSAKRAQSTFGHPLIAGGCFAGVSALMLYSRTRYSTLVAAILAGGALATVSRSAIIGLAFAVALGILIGRRRGSQILQALTIIIIAFVVATHVPALKQSIVNRTTGQTYTEQPVRKYALYRLHNDYNEHPTTLLFGGGVGTAERDLTNVGGINGYFIFDNQYVTSIYDYGILPMLAVALLIAYAITKAGKEARRLGLPALAAVAAVMFFVDGGEWLSLGFFAWATVGIASFPQHRPSGK